MLAGVGPFAIKRGLVEACDGSSEIAILIENTGQLAVTTLQTLGGHVTYACDAAISRVPGTAAPIPLAFRDTAGSSCGALLPTGNAIDTIEGVAVTMIDNGMVFAPADVEITGEDMKALRRLLDGREDI